MLWWGFPSIVVMDIWHFTEKIIKQWRKHIIGMFIHEQCYIVIIYICIFDAHWFEVEHQSQCEALCFVILIDFSDECYMLSPIHECNNLNRDKQMYSTRISMFHCWNLSCFKYYANTFCYFLIDIHYMRWPVQLIINDNSQEFSFSHLYNTGSINIDISHRSWKMLWGK